MKKLTFEAVSKALSYDPETGVFTRIGFFEEDRKNTRPDFIGQAAGSVGENGYVEISLANRSYAGHRLAFLFMTGKMPRYVDHHDGDRANNKWLNLRPCTQSQNMANRGPTVKSTTGIKGVYRSAASNRWRAQIMVNYKTIHLGYFKTLEEASEAYQEAAAMHFGEFAKELQKVVDTCDATD